jgi:DnaK suppressor protein
MNNPKSGLSLAFLEMQQKSLMELRSTLRSVKNADLEDESLIKEGSAGSARESDDDAQKLAALELDGNLVVRDLQRLQRVERALEKIKDGSYGLSDVSGQVIPMERLKIVPEAICTLSEEGAAEK